MRKQHLVDLEHLRDEFCFECGAVMAEKAGGLTTPVEHQAAGYELYPQETENVRKPLEYLHQVGLQEEYLL